MTNLPTVCEIEVGDGLTLESWKTDETIYVSIRSVCEKLGIASHRQIEKCRNNPLFNETIRQQHLLSPGGKQAVWCLPLDDFLAWLFTINGRSVKTEAKEPLLRYQRQSKQALLAYWTTGIAVQPESQPVNWYDMMRALLDRGEAYERELVEQKREIQRVEEKTDMALAAQQWSTIDSFVETQRLHRQLPPSLRIEFGKYLVVIAESRGLTIPRVPVYGRAYPNANEYPVKLIEEQLSDWLARRNGQIGIEK